MARCTKIISPNSEDAKYVINVKQIAKVSFNFKTLFLPIETCKAWTFVFCSFCIVETQNFSET